MNPLYKKAKQSEIDETVVLANSGLLTVFFNGSVYQTSLNAEDENGLGGKKDVFICSDDKIMMPLSDDRKTVTLEKTKQIPTEPRLGIRVLPEIYSLGELQEFAIRYRINGISSVQEFENFTHIREHSPDTRFCDSVLNAHLGMLTHNDVMRIFRQSFLITDEKQQNIGSFSLPKTSIAPVMKEYISGTIRGQTIDSINRTLRRIYYSGTPDWSLVSPINISLLIRSFNSFKGYEVVSSCGTKDGRLIYKEKEDKNRFNVYMLHIMTKNTVIINTIHETGSYLTYDTRRLKDGIVLVQARRYPAFIHSVEYTK